MNIAWQRNRNLQCGERERKGSCFIIRRHARFQRTSYVSTLFWGLDRWDMVLSEILGVKGFV